MPAIQATNLFREESFCARFFERLAELFFCERFAELFLLARLAAIGPTCE